MCCVYTFVNMHQIENLRFMSGSSMILTPMIRRPSLMGTRDLA
jgi:hypothetical protein